MYFCDIPWNENENGNPIEWIYECIKRLYHKYWMPVNNQTRRESDRERRERFGTQTENANWFILHIAKSLHAHCLGGKHGELACRSSVAWIKMQINSEHFHAIVLSLLLIDYVVVVCLISVKEKLMLQSPQLDSIVSESDGISVWRKFQVNGRFSFH